ncbi:MAG TPA: choice-of-anchor Q domain-containing protein [Kofleriaceae bacterium]|nr:choice-of-anchor Q domain-containing protein [Kofleriaceae bacterium]
MIDPTRHRSPSRRAAPLAGALALLAITISLALLASCSTEANPSFCCSDPADCSRFGVTDEKRECAAGLACVGHTCVSTACQSAADCDPSAPVCDGNACRACRLDAECASGACADDGTCVAESAIVYLAPQGVDVAPCSQAAPCKELIFAVEQTTDTRDHIVLAPGTYQLKRDPFIGPAATSATQLTVHGGGAILDLSTADIDLQIALPTKLRDLYIVHPLGTGIYIYSDVVIEHSTIGATFGITSRNHTTLRDVVIRATATGISLAGGSLTIDGATISGGTSAIIDNDLSSTGVEITNLLVYGTSDVALDLDSSTGSLKFVTIANSGTNSSTASGLKCAFVDVRSTIIWTPNSLRPPIVGNCFRSSTIAGPVDVPGTMNIDPKFISIAAENFRLAAGSPARDLSDSGPPRDFENDPRPQGDRFDIGADESP